jgi:hypothetical protein
MIYGQLNNKYIQENKAYGIVKISIIRFSSILSNILISSLLWPYNKTVAFAAILLHIAQITFSLNNKNNIHWAKPINELKFIFKQVNAQSETL